jgi:hypothetical protein
MAGGRGVFARWSARRRYLAADREAGQASEDFADLDPAARRDALLWMADCERAMSDTAFGFAAADEVDEDGRTLARSHGMAALLLTMVANTELEPGQPRQYFRLSNLDDDPAVANVLTALARATGLRARAVLTLTLSDLVVGQVGRQAVEVLTASVAYGYYRLSGLSHEHAQFLIRPDGPGRTR